VEEGGEWGVVTRERSGVENTAASRQGVQECHLASPGPSTCSSSSSQAILFVFFNCIMELTALAPAQDTNKAVKSMAGQAYKNGISVVVTAAP
jgi:hypothetical protein